jgi:hypothetical protein
MAFSISALAQQPSNSTGAKPTAPATQPSTAGTEPDIKPPANPITPTQIKEMQEATGAEAMKKRIVGLAIQSYRSQFPPYVPQDVIDDLDKSLESADLESHAAEIYPKYISTEDASKIIEFYKSPAGQRLVAAQPYMTSELQRSAVQIAQQTAKDVITRHKDEIEAAQKKYIEEHQQQKPSLSTPDNSPSNTPGNSKPQGTGTPQKP